MGHILTSPLLRNSALSLVFSVMPIRPVSSVSVSGAEGPGATFNSKEPTKVCAVPGTNWVQTSAGLLARSALMTRLAACHVGQDREWVGVSSVPAPGDDLIGANEGEVGSIEIAGFLRIQFDNCEVHTQFRRGALPGFGARCTAIETKKRPLKSEGVEQGSPIGEPQVRSAAARTSGRDVYVGSVRRRKRSVRDNHRRAVIASANRPVTMYASAPAAATGVNRPSTRNTPAVI